MKAIPAAIIAAGIGIGGFIASLPLAALGVAILLFAHGEKKRPKNKRR